MAKMTWLKLIMSQFAKKLLLCEQPAVRSLGFDGTNRTSWSGGCLSCSVFVGSLVYISVRRATVIAKGSFCDFP
jgi:hypothetical protein